MKVLAKGKKEKGWHKKCVCTGKGNGGFGCGAKLLVSEEDIYITESHHYDGSSESYYTFSCPECGTETDVDKNNFSSWNSFPSKKDFKSKEEKALKLKTGEVIRTVVDWPKPGVNFLDITTVLSDPELFRITIDEMAKLIEKKEVDKIIGIDARGFIFASALAYKLNKGMNIARKKGKLPGKTVGCKYGLEYGEAELELLEDAVVKGEKILIVDDVLATGGTAEAVAKIVEELGGEVSSFLFFVEIDFLKGKEKLGKYKINSLIHK